MLLLWVNPLSAVLSLTANAFYVFGYTMLLKRRTTQNIVWGGLAGCFPALIGWTAVTGELSWVPVVLFAVVFFWTPPHTWALALRYREDYANVDVPMLPVVAPAREVGRQVVLYSWVMVAVSLLLWPVADTGCVYPLAAAVLGAGFLLEAHRMWGRAPGHRGPHASSSRCGSSTPRTSTSRCSSSRSRSTRCSRADDRAAARVRHHRPRVSPKASTCGRVRCQTRRDRPGRAGTATGGGSCSSRGCSTSPHATRARRSAAAGTRGGPTSTTAAGPTAPCRCARFKAGASGSAASGRGPRVSRGERERAA